MALSLCLGPYGCSAADDGQARSSRAGVIPVVAGAGAAGTGSVTTTPVAGSSSLTRAGAPGRGGAAGRLGTGLPGAAGAGVGAPAVMPRAGTGDVGGSMASPPMPAAGSSGSTVTNPAECPAPPADAKPQAVMALAAVNNYRIPAGSGCITEIAEINKSAENHCLYYSMYMSGDMCIANPHSEVMGCAGFTGAGPGDRMRAAGYTSFGSSEVMAFVNDPQGSVDTWVNSVWHRMPILDPWTTHMGYGNAEGTSARCDTIDFGIGTTGAPADTVVVYPYDGQTDVPISFNGQYEGPMPPAPPSGWPSSLPISVYAKKIMVTEHVLTLDGDSTPIDHVWLDANASIVDASMRRALTNVVFMYANTPFMPNTKYHVKISGTYGSGALEREWTFTTGAAPTWPPRR